MTKQMQPPYKINRGGYCAKQMGAATLIVTVILMLAALLMMIYATQYSVLQQKTVSNQLQSNQAFEAAEAGLEFGLAYLITNASTITASASGGQINYGASDSNLTNVSLANNSTYSVVYTNPTANNFNLILITSTGISADGTSSRIVTQQVYSAATTIVYPLITQGNINMSGGSQIINTTAATTLYTGSSTVSMSGGSTITNNVGSYTSPTAPSTIKNDSTISGLTADQLFQNQFGISSNSMQAQANTYYNNSKNVNYNSLPPGITWIDQASGTASIPGGSIIGSAANPVLLIVNGNFTISGGAVFYGIVFVFGKTNVSGGANKIYGALLSVGQTTISGGSIIQYDSDIIKKAWSSGGSGSGSSYNKVPGSWKDF